MNDTRSLKKLLRDRFTAIRSSIDYKNKKEMDKSITNTFLRLPSVKKCDTILTYVSVNSEISTAEIITRCLEDGKAVAVPKCVGLHEMDFYIIKSLSDLSVGAYGIPEPDPEICEELTDFNNSVCTVPALAFDRRGYRLGYGGGYYDRFLAKYNGVVFGLCYSACISRNNLPCDKYDFRISSVITEKGITVCTEK